MRAVFGVLSLLIVLAIMATLVKKQTGALTSTTPGLPDTSAGATPQQQSQHIQQQLKQTVEGTLQQARPMPDDQ